MQYSHGAPLSDPIADGIIRALRAKPGGLTRTQIRDHFHRNRSRAEIGRALALLASRRLAKSTAATTLGRPVEVWFAAEFAPPWLTRTT